MAFVANGRYVLYSSLQFYADKRARKIGWEVMLVTGMVVSSFLAALSGGEITGRWLPPLWVERFSEIEQT